MGYVIAFSVTIGVFTVTHSVVGIVMVLLSTLILSEYDFLDIKKHIGKYLVVIVVGAVSVIIYDRRMVGSYHDLIQSYQGLSIPDHQKLSQYFVVVERKRSEQYLVQNQQTQRYRLLQSTSSLVPGAIIRLYQQPYRRKYNPELCILLCRQTGQVMDNDSLSGSKQSFDYDRWLYMKGIAGTIYDNTVSIVDYKDLGWLANRRESFYQQVTKRFDSIYAGLILGMTIGDKSLIDDDWYQQFIDSGLVHLIAVSGGNIAIVVIFCSIVLFWVPFYVRQVLLMVIIVVYAMIVGDDSSVIRAAVMGCMTLFILLPGRTVSIRRVLGYTRCGMLLYNPYYLFYDLGFTLSFGAVVGIIIVTDLYTKNRLESDDKNSLSQTVGPLIYVRQGYTYIISNYILPTIGAMIGTLPLLLYSMGKVNITALLINIGIVPLVPLITIMGFISPYVGWCWLDQSLLHLLDYILWLSQFGSDYGLFMVRNY